MSAFPLPGLKECHDCGLFHRVGPIDTGSVARCLRCNGVLLRRRHDPFDRPLALALSALALFAVATFMPFMSLDIGGQQVAASLFTGPERLEQQGPVATGPAGGGDHAGAHRC